MASFRDRMMESSKDDRQRIDSALASGWAPLIIGVIVVGVLVGAVWSTFA